MISTTALVVALVVTLVAAAMQGVIGMGFAVLSVPVLTLVDPALTPIPQLLLALPIAASVLWRERTAVDLRGAAWVLLGRLPGAGIGVFLLSVLPERGLNVFIAVVVIVMVVVLATGVTIPRNRLTEFGAGVGSGVTGVTSAMGGPPLAMIYQRERRGDRLRSTLSTIFLVGLTINIASVSLAGVVTRTDLRVAGILLPAALVGVWLSRFVKDRASPTVLRAGLLGVAAIAAVGLLVSTALR